MVSCFCVQCRHSTVFEPSLTLLVSQSVNTEGPFSSSTVIPHSPPTCLLFSIFFYTACVCHVSKECFKHVMLQSFCNVTRLIYVFGTFRGAHRVKNLRSTRFEVYRTVLFRIEFMWNVKTVQVRA